MSFTKSESANVVIWAGSPDCDAGHLFILNKLREFGVTFLPDVTKFSNKVVGNLGEFLAFILGIDVFPEHKRFPANALNPLNTISKSDLDIIWIHFGKTAKDDYAIVQEVKTTGDPTLSYANDLIKDYDKLFTPDPSLSLHNRLQCLKNEIEWKLELPELCPRVSLLAGNGPSTSPKIQLLPTLFHELRDSDPQRKMVTIRSSLISRGWSPDVVKAWAIGITDLDDRLKRIALGQN